MRASLALLVFLLPLALASPDPQGLPAALDDTPPMVRFTPDRVHLVDRAGENFLFRGDRPSKDGTFLYDELTRVMTDVLLREANATFPRDYHLIDVNLLNELQEHDDIKVEEEWFQKNPDKGTFLHWPVYGDLTNPSSYPSFIREAIARNMPHWNLGKLPSRIPELHERLGTQGSKPKVFYVHCEAGTDRTGEVCGTYSMQFLGMSFRDALYVANHIQHRDISPYSKHGMQWYCEYLKARHLADPGPC